MSPPDDRPEITPSDDAWLDALHKNPAYLKILDEIDLDDPRPGVPAEDVRRWVESLGTDQELPKPKAR